MRQTGSAVVGALLIVVIVTALATALMARQSVFVRGVQNEQSQIQARLLQLAGRDWALQRLQAAQANGPLVRWDDAWAMPLRDSLLGQDEQESLARYSGQIEDAQARFNLRNLVRDGALDSAEAAIFQRLCELAGVKADIARRIMQRMVLAQPRAGETPRPAQDEHPAQAPLPRSVEDLAPIEGMDDETLSRLRPVLSILPVPTWLNGNSAGPLVLAAHVPGMSVDQARALLAERDAGNSFINLGDFFNRLNRPDLDMNQLRVGITSEWFLLSGVVRAGPLLSVSRSLIFRPAAEPGARLIWMREGL